MAKNVQHPTKPVPRAGRSRRYKAEKRRQKPVGDNLSGQDVRVVAKSLERDRVGVVLEAATRSGLMTGKSGRITGRVSPALVEEAKKMTGIEADSDLIAFALANVALKDDFAKAFKDVRGTIDADLKLGF
jgi:hypothetical protein